MPVYDEYKDVRESIKDKPFKEKMAYFWYYYKIHTIVGIFLLILLAVFIKDRVNNKEYAYTCTLVNAVPVNEATGFMDEFVATTDIDTSKYIAYLDDQVQFSFEGYDQTSMAMMQKFVAMVYAGDIDNVVMEHDLFTNYANNEAFIDLRTVLTPEEIEKYEDYFFYIDYDNLGNESPDFEAVASGNTEELVKHDEVDRKSTEGMSNPVPVGIFLEDELGERIKSVGFYGEDADIVFGFLTEKHLDYSRQFLDWLTAGVN